MNMVIINKHRHFNPFTDEIVQDVYRHKNNYKVHEGELNSKNCIIFFSGNGLYYPNEESLFIKKILKQDYFEWENISRDKKFLSCSKKIIFVRDVHKQWYVEGINESIDTVDKTYEFLKEISAGQNIITVGNSAGGYAAVLFGCLLKAEKIFSISGQFYLSDISNEKLLWKYKDDPSRSCYYDLRSLLKDYRGTVFYFYPCKSADDMNQAAHVGDLENIHFVKIKSSKHGDGPYPDNYKYIFFTERSVLRQRIETEPEYSKARLLYKTVPFFDFIIIYIKGPVKKKIRACIEYVDLFFRTRF